MIRLVPFFLLGGVGGPTVIFGWQTYTWLRFGVWPALPLFSALNALGVRTPRVDWVELQQAIEYVYGCPLSIVVFVTFGALAWLATLE